MRELETVGLNLPHTMPLNIVIHEDCRNGYDRKLSKICRVVISQGIQKWKMSDLL